MTPPSEIGLLRLVAQRLAGPRPATPVEAVRRLLAVQAQELPGALTSTALRTASRSREDVGKALDEGVLVRSWPMRGTLHLTVAEDLPWLLDLCTPRVLAGLGSRWAQLGLTEADAERARAVVIAALSGGRRLGRRALVAAMADGGVDTAGQRGYHLLGHLAQTGTLCLGPREDGGDQQFVLLDEWIPRRRRLERGEALAELALRFFQGHGPATVKDLARWAGLSLGDARTGLAAVRDHLLSLDVAGAEHYLDPGTPDLLAAHRDEARGPFLLPGFDEFVLGYGDRSAVLDPAFADRIVPGGNGVFRPTVVHDGRIVGTWAWQGTGARRTAVASPFVPHADDVTSAVLRLAVALP
ncbi:winged helix DNA-binding domain-containing protein [Blastococcus deserti]|uniref:Winged helix DNA-binding domain-containing protein n=1 Tax=Blastococcus deserti TaxID=2259033 RepID=A0ABW4XDT7_9ACTN